MTDLQKFQRVCRVFLARLLTVYGPAAPDLLRRFADDDSRRSQSLNAARSPGIVRGFSLWRLDAAILSLRRNFT